MHGKMKAAVVGCGKISGVYLENMTKRFHTLEITACCAAHIENARRKAEQYGIHACTYEEILQDGSIEMVVILTPAPTHYGLIKEALLAGKHVYTEKTMTLEVEQSKELMQIADERNLYLGCAPETFLGDGIRTAKKAIDDGLIGEVTSFHIGANRNYDRLTSRVGFLRMPGGGICYDYSVYYLTALVGLLGPAESVFAEVKNPHPVRKNVIPGSPEYGQEFDSPNESLAYAVLKLENGITGTFQMNGESVGEDLADFRIYGTKGVLLLPDPNEFGGDVVFIPDEKDRREIVLDKTTPFVENCRGIGPSEMVWAIREKRPCMTDGTRAVHVLDIVAQILKSGQTGTRQQIETTCTPDSGLDISALTRYDHA